MRWPAMLWRAFATFPLLAVFWWYTDNPVQSHLPLSQVPVGVQLDEPHQIENPVVPVEIQITGTQDLLSVPDYLDVGKAWQAFHRWFMTPIRQLHMQEAILEGKVALENLPVITVGTHTLRIAVDPMSAAWGRLLRYNPRTPTCCLFEAVAWAVLGNPKLVGHVRRRTCALWGEAHKQSLLEQVAACEGQSPAEYRRSICTTKWGGKPDAEILAENLQCRFVCVKYDMGIIYDVGPRTAPIYILGLHLQHYVVLSAIPAHLRSSSAITPSERAGGRIHLRSRQPSRSPLPRKKKPRVVDHSARQDSMAHAVPATSQKQEQKAILPGDPWIDTKGDRSLTEMEPSPPVQLQQPLQNTPTAPSDHVQGQPYPLGDLVIKKSWGPGCSDWDPYCSVCNRWATAAHLASNRHVKRALYRKEKHARLATSTTHDVAIQTSEDIQPLPVTPCSEPKLQDATNKEHRTREDSSCLDMLSEPSSGTPRTHESPDWGYSESEHEQHRAGVRRSPAPRWVQRRVQEARGQLRAALTTLSRVHCGYLSDYSESDLDTDDSSDIDAQHPRRHDPHHCRLDPDIDPEHVRPQRGPRHRSPRGHHRPHHAHAHGHRARGRPDADEPRPDQEARRGRDHPEHHANHTTRSRSRSRQPYQNQEPFLVTVQSGERARRVWPMHYYTAETYIAEVHFEYARLARRGSATFCLQLNGEPLEGFQKLSSIGSGCLVFAPSWTKDNDPPSSLYHPPNRNRPDRARSSGVHRGGMIRTIPEVNDPGVAKFDWRHLELYLETKALAADQDILSHECGHDGLSPRTFDGMAPSEAFSETSSPSEGLGPSASSVLHDVSSLDDCLSQATLSIHDNANCLTPNGMGVSGLSGGGGLTPTIPFPNPHPSPLPPCSPGVGSEDPGPRDQDAHERMHQEDQAPREYCYFHGELGLLYGMAAQPLAIGRAVLLEGMEIAYVYAPQIAPVISVFVWFAENVSPGSDVCWNPGKVDAPLRLKMGRHSISPSFPFLPERLP